MIKARYQILDMPYIQLYNSTISSYIQYNQYSQILDMPFILKVHLKDSFGFFFFFFFWVLIGYESHIYFSFTSLAFGLLSLASPCISHQGFHFVLFLFIFFFGWFNSDYGYGGVVSVWIMGKRKAKQGFWFYAVLGLRFDGKYEQIAIWVVRRILSRCFYI